MPELILQYILIVVLVVALGYLVYFLKEKGVIRDQDYFGITYTILGMLENNEATSQNVKKILRAVSASVQSVESNYKDESNELKEEKALDAAKAAIAVLNLNSSISDKSLLYIIHLACALLPPTGKDGSK